jgi:hypothetical protein
MGFRFGWSDSGAGLGGLLVCSGCAGGGLGTNFSVSSVIISLSNYIRADPRVRRCVCDSTQTESARKISHGRYKVYMNAGLTDKRRE